MTEQMLLRWDKSAFGCPKNCLWHRTGRKKIKSGASIDDAYRSGWKHFWGRYRVCKEHSTGWPLHINLSSHKKCKLKKTWSWKQQASAAQKKKKKERIELLCTRARQSCHVLLLTARNRWWISFLLQATNEIRLRLRKKLLSSDISQQVIVRNTL